MEVAMEHSVARARSASNFVYGYDLAAYPRPVSTEFYRCYDLTLGRSMAKWKPSCEDGVSVDSI